MSASIFTRSDFPSEKIQNFVGQAKIAVLGYGAQGRAQALNLRDQGFDVIVGQRPASHRYQQAQDDGWKSGQNLLNVAAAAAKADTIYYLLSDTGQSEFWPQLKPHLTSGKTLVFAHGFAVVYADQTGVVPPTGLDVLLVAPKGLGLSLREKFKSGQGASASFAVFQDASGHAHDKALAHCFAIGANAVFPTTFQNEVISDLVSERGIILGGLMAMMEAQYDVLRAHGHSAEEAFNDTVEEVTEWLARAVGDMGFDGLLPHCSQTAQIGALKWREKFLAALKPVFEDLYQSVAHGQEAREVLLQTDAPHNQLSKMEIWQTAQTIRRTR